MPIDYGELTQGQEISNESYVLDPGTVSKYVDAVGDQTRVKSRDGRELVPAMAVAALSFRGVLDGLQLPGGTVHVGQELEFSKAVAVGETVRCSAKLLQNSVRRGTRVMVVLLEVSDGAGDRALEGKSTVMVPAQLPSNS